MKEIKKLTEKIIKNPHPQTAENNYRRVYTPHAHKNADGEPRTT